MIKYLRNNVGIPASHGMIPDGLPGGGKIKGYDYQPDKARSYVKELKTEGLLKDPLQLATSANYLDLCEYIQKEWQKIGIPVEIDVMPAGTLRKMRKEGQLELFRSSWIADYPDAENYLSLFTSSNHTPKGSNYTYYTNEIYDQWHAEIGDVIDVDLRAKHYEKMDSLLMANPPVIPLYYDQSTRFVHQDVRGLAQNTINLLDLRKAYKIPKQ